MRTYAQLQFVVTRDVEQRQKLVDQLLSFDDTADATNASYQAGVIDLAPSTVDVAVPFGGVTAAATVLIVAWSEVQVKLEGDTNDYFTIRPVPESPTGVIYSTLQKKDQPGVLFLRGRVTSIHLSNPSTGEVAEVFVALTGNAT